MFDSAQLINTEQERDKLSIEINRLSMQCQQLKSTQERLVAEHSKTLERVNELWKQKWPGAYDEVRPYDPILRSVYTPAYGPILSVCVFFSFTASLGGEARYSLTGTFA